MDERKVVLTLGEKLFTVVVGRDWRKTNSTWNW